MLDGWPVGFVLGLDVGCTVGIPDGRPDGCALGIDDGSNEGLAVGLFPVGILNTSQRSDENPTLPDPLYDIE